MMNVVTGYNQLRLYQMYYSYCINVFRTQEVSRMPIAQLIWASRASDRNMVNLNSFFSFTGHWKFNKNWLILNRHIYEKFSASEREDRSFFNLFTSIFVHRLYTLVYVYTKNTPELESANYLTKECRKILPDTLIWNSAHRLGLIPLDISHPYFPSSFSLASCEPLISIGEILVKAEVDSKRFSHPESESWWEMADQYCVKNSTYRHSLLINLFQIVEEGGWPIPLHLMLNRSLGPTRMSLGFKSHCGGPVPKNWGNFQNLRDYRCL